MVDLGQVARQIYERSREGAQSRGVRIDLGLPSNHANTVFADRHLVSRVIDNLVSNALKFAETTAAMQGRIWTDNGKDGLTHFYVSFPTEI